MPEPAERTKTVVQSGRLVDFKNQPMLIRAFVEVHKKYPAYDLKIYGGDSFDGTKEILERIIEENQAQSYVHLMGASDSLEKELADAALFAFTSDWEGLPNALMEAMALGLPIVATDCPCGGPRTIMTHEKDGLLIPIKMCIRDRGRAGGGSAVSSGRDQYMEILGYQRGLPPGADGADRRLQRGEGAVEDAS